MNRRKFLSMTMGVFMSTVAHSALANNPTNFVAQDIVIGGWHLYKARFLDESGRIVDNVNGDISHSEGQGYAMLLAVAANDKAGFDKIWRWTQKELFIRDDHLAAWKWEPNQSPNVTDTNNATDGDLLIAWALLRARLIWREDSYIQTARNILKDVREKLIIETEFGRALLPGEKGFGADDQSDGPLINLSYWVFPAISELGLIDPLFPDQELIETGLTLIQKASFGPSGLPANWLSLADNSVKLAENFEPFFGYDSVRIPLYLAWYSNEHPELLNPYANAWVRDGGYSLKVVDLPTGKAVGAMTDAGYRALADIVVCAKNGVVSDNLLNNFSPSDYYPSTLHILSLLAISERYPTCLINQF